MPETDDGYRCDACGKFCKRVPSIKWEQKWRCTNCNISFKTQLRDKYKSKKDKLENEMKQLRKRK